MRKMPDRVQRRKRGFLGGVWRLQQEARRSPLCRMLRRPARELGRVLRQRPRRRQPRNNQCRNKCPRRPDVRDARSKGPRVNLTQGPVPGTECH